MSTDTARFDPADLGAAPAIDVVVCCYTLRRWTDVLAGIDALGRQTIAPRSVLVVVDYNDELFDRCVGELPSRVPFPVRVVRNHETKGLSGARNSGIAAAEAEFVAFLDDDAVPDPSWLELLAAPFADDAVQVTGGYADPRWPDRRPSWFPPEFDWVIGCTYRGMPTETADVRNVHGASMLFRASVFEKVGGFVEGVGRVDTIPRGCEETELCIRVRRDGPNRIVYVPDSVVRHRVSDDRVAPKYFVTRCWAEGLSKAAIAKLVGDDAATETERDYVRKTLTGAVLRDVARAARGNVSALARAGAVVLGFGITAAGYVAGTASGVLRRLIRRR